VATYYVNTAADAGGDGTTTALTGANCAFKTIAQVNAASIVATDTVNFKAGCEWRETLTPQANGIIYTRYGAGADPIFNGSDLFEDFSDAGGNVWTKAVTTEPKIVFFNGTRGTKAASAGAVDAALEWFWATNLLTIYSVGDPDSTYAPRGIEVGQRNYGLLNMNRSSLQVRYLHFTKCNGNGVYGQNSSGNIYEYNTVDWNAPGLGGGVRTSAVSAYEFRYNTFQQNGTSNQENGIYLVDSTTDCIVEYNSFISNGNGSGNGVQITEHGDDNIIRYNWFYGNRGMVLLWGSGSGMPSGNQIYYNIGVGTSGFVIGGVSDTNTNDIYNNTFYGTVWGYGLQMTENSMIRSFKNNILWNSGVGQGPVYIAGTGSVTNMDYNCLGPESSNFIHFQGTAYSTLAAYHAASGYDEHSMASNPSFVNGSGSYTEDTDFRISLGSPCINNGAQVGLTSDYEGHLIR
jgi:parallel beta-helix repeat protein